MAVCTLLIQRGTEMLPACLEGHTVKRKYKLLRFIKRISKFSRGYSELHLTVLNEASPLKINSSRGSFVSHQDLHETGRMYNCITDLPWQSHGV